VVGRVSERVAGHYVYGVKQWNIDDARSSTNQDSILSHLNSIQRAIFCLFNIWCEIIRSSETNTANIAWICNLCSVGLRTYQHPCSRPISIRPYSVSGCGKSILFPDLTSSLYQSHHRRKKPLVKNEWCRPTLKMYVGEEHNLS
jgi:hypothetical protein